MKTKTKYISPLTPGPLIHVAGHCLSNQQIKWGGDKASLFAEKSLEYTLDIKNKTKQTKLSQNLVTENVAVSKLYNI